MTSIREMAYEYFLEEEIKAKAIKKAAIEKLKHNGFFESEAKILFEFEVAVVTENYKSSFFGAI